MQPISAIPSRRASNVRDGVESSWNFGGSGCGKERVRRWVTSWSRQSDPRATGESICHASLQERLESSGSERRGACGHSGGQDGKRGGLGRAPGGRDREIRWLRSCGHLGNVSRRAVYFI